MERRNAEGYHDPTAYGGMRMAEQKAEKETVKMVYKNGRMELYIHEFFPCRLAVAKKVFPLIRRFAKEDDREKLRQFLRIKAREHGGLLFIKQCRFFRRRWRMVRRELWNVRAVRRRRFRLCGRCRTIHA